MSDSPKRSIIELSLTAQQIAALEPLVLEEPRTPVLFVTTAAPHLEGPIQYWRLQAKRLTHKQAAGLMKLLREPEKPRPQNQAGDEKH